MEERKCVIERGRYGIVQTIEDFDIDFRRLSNTVVKILPQE